MRGPRGIARFPQPEGGLGAGSGAGLRGGVVKAGGGLEKAAGPGWAGWVWCCT